MLLIGLTGGIGSGKSTVAAALALRGALVIDADAIVRDLQAPGMPVLAAMAERFGADILRVDGSLDRQRVADRVFRDPTELEALNAIVHPAVGLEIGRRVAEQKGTDRVVVLDVPLLVERGTYRTDGTVVVDVDPATAVERLVAFRGFTAEDAEARIARQANREQRLAAADFVIANDGPAEALDAQIEACWEWIEGLRSVVSGD